MKQLFLLFFLLTLALGAKAQFSTNQGIPLCWSNSPQGDSTIYVSENYMVGEDSPTKLFYFDQYNQAVTLPNGANLSFGACGIAAGNDWEISRVCWDSAGVYQDLTAIRRFSQSDLSFQTFFYDINDQRIAPTIGIVAGGNSSLRVGSCIEILQENEITNKPDSCNCSYVLDLENHNYSTENNSKRVTWTYEKVVRRNCGPGNEEILRMPFSYEIPNILYNTYSNENTGSAPLQDGSGYINEVALFFSNPNGQINVDLNPNTVLASYPSLGVFNTNRLIYTIGNSDDWELAVQEVITEAIKIYSLINNQPIPNLDFIVTVNNGTFDIGFAVVNAPTGHHVGINLFDAAAQISYFPDGNTINFIERKFFSFGNAAITGIYDTPCAEITTRYTGTIINQLETNWLSIIPVDANPTLILSQGQTNCSLPCNSIESSDCVMICDTVMVRIVENIDEEKCSVRGVSNQDRLTGELESASYAANTLNSITIYVKSGSLFLTIAYTDPITGQFTTETETYEQDEIIAFTHPNDCKYLNNSFVIYGLVATSDIKILTLQ